MKRPHLVICLILLTAVFAVAETAGTLKKAGAETSTSKQQKSDKPPVAVAQTTPKSQEQSASASSQGAGSLQAVLGDMDRAAASFKSAQADFTWDQYQKVINETDTQKGTIYFRRTQKQTEMAADIRGADPNESKYVLFTGNKLRVYQPGIDQVTEYNAGKNSGEFEAFLVLGFGGSGRDLLNAFDVKYAGTEQVGGINAAKLELTPKAQRVRGVFNRIILWIDPETGISVQQQFFEPESGNYRLTKYSNIKLNQKIPDDVFKLKTTGKTKTVRPNG